jgi:ribosome-associated protein
MSEIIKGIHIDEGSLGFQASRSSGPGGQNVNKVNTRITVIFDVKACPSLSDEQKSRILARLRSRATAQGIIHVTSQSHRSQAANRNAAVERLFELLRVALTPRPRRKPTTVPYRAKQRRLEKKAKRGSLKKLRTADITQD